MDARLVLNVAYAYGTVVNLELVGGRDESYIHKPIKISNIR